MVIFPEEFQCGHNQALFGQPTGNHVVCAWICVKVELAPDVPLAFQQVQKSDWFHCDLNPRHVEHFYILLRPALYLTAVLILLKFFWTWIRGMWSEFKTRPASLYIFIMLQICEDLRIVEHNCSNLLHRLKSSAGS